MARLIMWAATVGGYSTQNALVEELFKAYFTQVGHFLCVQLSSYKPVFVNYIMQVGCQWSFAQLEL
jgi:hypothetical protein